jgi:hypothetical protein
MLFGTKDVLDNLHFLLSIYLHITQHGTGTQLGLAILHIYGAAI